MIKIKEKKLPNLEIILLKHLSTSIIFGHSVQFVHWNYTGPDFLSKAFGYLIRIFIFYFEPSLLDQDIFLSFILGILVTFLFLFWGACPAPPE